MTQRTLGEWLAYLEQLHPSAIDMIIPRGELRPRLGSLLAQMMGLPTPVYIAPKVEPIVVPPVPANL